jgi:hypothetical protein
MTCRSPRPTLFAASLACLLSACEGSTSDCAPGTKCAPRPPLVSIEGDVLAFLTEVPGPRIAGAKVTILEHPEMSVVTGADAHFRFDGLEQGTDVTLVVEHPNLKPTQSSTITLGPNGVNPFTVQVVPVPLFKALAAIVPLPPEEDKYCAIASTVARFGGSLFVQLRQGIPGASVTLTPAVLPESGPLYFDEDVLPDATQTSTSIDGGVLFYRVPPGDYVLRATRPGAAFAEVKLTCRAGFVVNAGPPFGPLANTLHPDYAAGKDRPADADSMISDALCDATAACVNAKNADHYPPATVASCKAQFRNVWASVDAACDATAKLRDAARAVYTCRAKSCDLTLGDDAVCATEEAAFRAAEETYGACYAAK